MKFPERALHLGPRKVDERIEREQSAHPPARERKAAHVGSQRRVESTTSEPRHRLTDVEANDMASPGPHERPDLTGTGSDLHDRVVDRLGEPLEQLAIARLAIELVEKSSLVLPCDPVIRRAQLFPGQGSRTETTPITTLRSPRRSAREGDRRRTWLRTR